MTDPIPLRALIVDDEAASRLALKKRLHSVTAQIEICGEASNGKSALELIDNISPDIVFLDIAMPGPNGLTVARRIAGQASPLIVFLTAYGDRALEAYETDAIDYLTKPVAAQRLSRCVEKIYSEFRKRRKLAISDELISVMGKFDNAANAAARPAYKTVVLDTGATIARVDESEIIYLEAAGEYSCVHTQSETFAVRNALKTFERDLLSDRFYRIHRQTIVNLDQIDTLIDTNNAKPRTRMLNGAELAVSRRKLPGLKSILD